MDDPHKRLATLVKRRFFIARWMFIPILLLGTVMACWFTDSLAPIAGYWLILIFIILIGAPIVFAYAQRVSCKSKNFVYYYTQRGRHEIGFHLRRKRRGRRPSKLDLESESNAELCKGLRTLRNAAPATMNIESAHFGDPANLLMLKQLVSQTNPSQLTEIKRYKANCFSSVLIRLAIHGFRWKTPFKSILFLYRESMNTYVSGVRVSYCAPNNSFKPTPLRGAA